ncbi:MAG: hypothetical protein GYB64_03755 [Chloroflexi bacterium]|nr:hypothetical protein [Chloroflexota bacterium]
MKHPLALISLLLIGSFGLALGSSLDKSPTFDEAFYIARGWAFWRTGELFSLGHPPLTNLLVGAGVLLEPGLPDPAALDGWEEGDPEAISESLLWERGLNAERITFLARVPIIWLTALLGAIVYRWAADLYRSNGGLLALTLFAFSPNVLAHGRLATTDLGVAAFYIATLWAWSHWLRRRTSGWLVVAGLLFGFAQAAKFSALLLIPTLGVITLAAGLRQRRLLGDLTALVAMGSIGLFSLWASHLFTVRPLAEGMYPGELLHFLGLAAEGHTGYLLGRFSQTGWWTYHLVTLAVKWTEPALLLVFGAALSTGWRSLHPREWTVLFPALFYIGITLLISLNVGVRYLLPATPLLFVFAGRLTQLEIRLVRPALSGLAAIHILIAVVVFPHYIPYFNLASGGPDRGHRILADSNLDWGQDLPGLAAYLQQHSIDDLHLSYYGQAYPTYYDIDAKPLPSWPPPPEEPEDFHPLHPDPGWYAISVSNLIGAQLFEHDSFGYFRARQPEAVVGHSIHVYRVEPRADPPVGLLCRENPVLTEERLRAWVGRPDLPIAYIDCDTSSLAPSLLLAPVDSTPPGTSAPPDFLGRHEDGRPHFYGWHLSSPATVADETAFTLLNAELIRSGDTLTVTGTWQVNEPLTGISIFAHLTAPDGFLLAAGDALGVPAEAFTSGAVLIQHHTLSLPADIEPGSYPVLLGVYRLDTGERLPVTFEGQAAQQTTVGTVDITR